MAADQSCCETACFPLKQRESFQFKQVASRGWTEQKIFAMRLFFSFNCV